MKPSIANLARRKAGPQPTRNPLTSNTGPLIDLQATIKNARQAVKTERREFLNALRIANAAEHIRELPAPDITLHCVMKGNYNAWDIVPAILKLIAPACIEHLCVATLGFNASNTDQLVTLIDAGRIHSAKFLCSAYYGAHEPAVCKKLNDELRARGSVFLSTRTHAKVIAARTTCGNNYVWEGSANLRSCRNVEQFIISNSAEVFDFHSAWMCELIDGEKENSEETQPGADG